MPVDDIQIGRMVEAVETLKTSHENICRTLSQMNVEQTKQTALLSQACESMTETKNSVTGHETRIGDLEKSRAKIIGAASAFGFMSGLFSSFLGRHS